MKRSIPLLVISLFLAHSSASSILFDSDVSEESKKTNPKTSLTGFQEGDYFSSTTFSLSTSHLCWIGPEEMYIRCIENSLISANQMNESLSEINSSNYVTEYSISTSDFSELYGEPISISAGSNFACSVTSRSIVICWPYNSMYFHSEGVPIGSENVVYIGGKPASTLSSSGDNFCTITADHSIWCWEAKIPNDSKQTPQFKPLRVMDGSQFSSRSISMGENHACSITYEQEIICWNQTNPQEIITFESRTISQTNYSEPLTYPVSVSTGFSELCVLHSDYEVTCWKYSGEISVLGVNLSLDDPIVISSGGDYFCTVNSMGSIVCWGEKGPLSSFDGSIIPAISLTQKGACFILIDSPEISCIPNNDFNTSYHSLSGVTTIVPSLDFDSDIVTNNFDIFPFDSERSVYCSNGYFGKFQCFPSQPGHFVTEVNAMNQSSCTFGSFQPLFAQASCIPSPPGHYVPSEGAGEPTPCPAGTFHNVTGATSLEQCSGTPSQGFYSPPGSHSPIPSPPGHYVPSEGAGEPTPCPSGNYLAATSAISVDMCELTPIGYFSESGGIAPCPSGTFLNLTGATSIDQCEMTPAGFYSTEGSSSPTACPPGKWQINPGSNSCFDSEIGHFSPLMGSTEQTPCPVGTYQSQTGQSNCEIASRGHFSREIASTEQFECLPGQFQPDYGGEDCLEATPGHYVENSASHDQTPCPPGFYQDNFGSLGCKISPINHFTSNWGSIKPILCPDGSENNLSGEQNIYNCKLDSDGDGLEDMFDEYPNSEFNFRAEIWSGIIFLTNAIAIVMINRIT